MGKRKTITGQNLKTKEKRTFNSIRAAAERTGAQYRHIVDVINGKRKSTGGWKFSEYDGQTPKTPIIPINKPTTIKKKDDNSNWWGNVYHYTKERGPFQEKCARWDERGVIVISYNYYADIIDQVVPNLTYMREVTMKRVEMLYGKCIYILDGNVSRSKGSKEEKYFITAQLSIRMNSRPTEKQLKRIEQLITNVQYADEKGENKWNIERLGKRIYGDEFADLRKRNNIKVRKYQDWGKNTAIVGTHKITGETVEMKSVKTAAEFVGTHTSTIYNALQGRLKTAGGYKWTYKEAN